MDASAQYLEILKLAEKSWRLSSDSVKRMACLRAFFRDVHNLLNTLYASPEPRQTESLIHCHTELQQLPETLLSLPVETLQQLLIQSPSISSFLQVTRTSASGIENSVTDSGVTHPPMPQAINRPDREWEQVIWRASLGASGWSLCSRRESSTLADFAANAALRERELNSSGVVLAVTCLTSTGDFREWEWYFLAHQGGQP